MTIMITLYFKPGDFVLLKNCRTNKPGLNSAADLVCKVPGSGQSFGRTILKLASVNGDLSHLQNIAADVTLSVKSILNKVKEFDLNFLSADEVCNQIRSKFSSNSMNDSMDEVLVRKLKETENLIQNKENINKNGPKTSTNGKKLKIDLLWKDQESMYQSDSDDELNCSEIIKSKSKSIVYIVKVLTIR